MLALVWRQVATPMEASGGDIPEHPPFRFRVLVAEAVHHDAFGIRLRRQGAHVAAQGAVPDRTPDAVAERDAQGGAEFAQAAVGVTEALGILDGASAQYPAEIPGARALLAYLAVRV